MSKFQNCRGFHEANLFSKCQIACRRRWKRSFWNSTKKCSRLIEQHVNKSMFTWKTWFWNCCQAMKRFPHIYNKRPLFLSSVSLLFVLYLIESTLSNQSSGFIIVVSHVFFFLLFITFYAVENEIVSRNSVIQGLNMRIKHEFKKYFMDSVFNWIDGLKTWLWGRRQPGKESREAGPNTCKRYLWHER